MTYTLDGFVTTAEQYIAGFRTASVRSLSYTPTSAVTLTYDCYVETGVGGIIEVKNGALQNIDIASTATADGIAEVNFLNDHSNQLVTALGTVVVITPITPLPPSATISATVATGVIKNHLGPFALSFDTCDCVCRSNSPYEIQASDDVGHISSGVDWSAGSRLCQWQLTAPPGRILSVSLNNLYIPPSLNDTADPALLDNADCTHDYLELRDGDDSGRVIWRKCRSDFTIDQTFEMTSNQLYLVLKTSGASNASFSAEYGDSQKQLDLVFTQDTNGPPVMVGIPILIPWVTVYPLPGSSWVGLYKQGSCDEDNEWRHNCMLASKSLPAGTATGVVEFPYPEYREAGYYELRFFTGANQGRTCNVQNRYYNDDDVTSYSKCQLMALATVTVYVAPAGSVPQEHVPGLREYDSRFYLVK